MENNHMVLTIQDQQLLVAIRGSSIEIELTKPLSHALHSFLSAEEKRPYGKSTLLSYEDLTNPSFLDSLSLDPLSELIINKVRSIYTNTEASLKGRPEASSRSIPPTHLQDYHEKIFSSDAPTATERKPPSVSAALNTHTNSLSEQGTNRLPSNSHQPTIALNLVAHGKKFPGNPDTENSTPGQAAAAKILTSQLLSTTTQLFRRFIHSQKAISLQQQHSSSSPSSRRPPMAYSGPSFDPDNFFISTLSFRVVSGPVPSLDFVPFLVEKASMIWTEEKRNNKGSLNAKRGVKKEMGRPFLVVDPNNITLWKERLKNSPGEPPRLAPMVPELLHSLRARVVFLRQSLELAKDPYAIRAVMAELLVLEYREVASFLPLPDPELGLLVYMFLAILSMELHGSLDDKEFPVVTVTDQERVSAVLAIALSHLESERRNAVISEIVFAGIGESLTVATTFLDSAQAAGEDEDENEAEAAKAAEQDEQDDTERSAAIVSGLTLQEVTLNDAKRQEEALAVVRTAVEAVDVVGKEVVFIVGEDDDRPFLGVRHHHFVTVDVSLYCDKEELAFHLQRKLLIQALAHHVPDLKLAGAVLVAHPNAVHAIHKLQWKARKHATAINPKSDVWSLSNMISDASGALMAIRVSTYATDHLNQARLVNGNAQQLEEAMFLGKVLRSQPDIDAAFITRRLRRQLLKENNFDPVPAVPPVPPVPLATPKLLVNNLLEQVQQQWLPQVSDQVSLTGLVMMLYAHTSSSLTELINVAGTDGHGYLEGSPARLPQLILGQLSEEDMSDCARLRSRMRGLLLARVVLDFPNTLVKATRAALQCSGTPAQVLATLGALDGDTAAAQLETVTERLEAMVEERVACWVGDVITASLAKVTTVSSALLIGTVADSNRAWLPPAHSPASAEVKARLVQAKSCLARQLCHLKEPCSDCNNTASRVAKLVFVDAPKLTLIPDEFKNGLSWIHALNVESHATMLTQRTAAVLKGLKAVLRVDSDELLKTAWPEVISSLLLIESLPRATYAVRSLKLAGPTMGVPLQIASRIWRQSESDGLSRPLLSSDGRTKTGAVTGPNSKPTNDRPVDYGLLHLARFLQAGSMIAVDPNSGSVASKRLSTMHLLNQALGMPVQDAVLCTQCHEDGGVMRPVGLVPCSNCLLCVDHGAENEQPWLSMIDIFDDAGRLRGVTSRRRDWAKSGSNTIATDWGCSLAQRAGQQIASSLNGGGENDLSVLMSGLRARMALDAALTATSPPSKSWEKRLYSARLKVDGGKKLTQKELRSVTTATSAMSTLHDKGPALLSSVLQSRAERESSLPRLRFKAARTRRRILLRARWKQAWGAHKDWSNSHGREAVVWGDGHAGGGSAKGGRSYANISALSAVSDLTRVYVVGEGGSSARCAKDFMPLGKAGASMSAGDVSKRQGFKLRLCNRCKRLESRDRGSCLSIGLIAVVIWVFGRKLFGSNQATESTRDSEDDEKDRAALDQPKLDEGPLMDPEVALGKDGKHAAAAAAEGMEVADDDDGVGRVDEPIGGGGGGGGGGEGVSDHDMLDLCNDGIGFDVQHHQTHGKRRRPRGSDDLEDMARPAKRQRSFWAGVALRAPQAVVNLVRAAWERFSAFVST